MARILLLSPPFGDVYRIDFKKKQLGVPPIGIATLGGYLKQNGHDVKLIDMVYFDEGIDGIERIISFEKPDYVGMSSTTPQMNNIITLADKVKKIRKETKIIVGGPHVSALPLETLNECESIDYVIFGEGEETTNELLKGIDPEKILGLAFRKLGKLIINQRRPPIKNLDDLPYPLYEQLPLKYYGYPLLGPSIGLMSGRGCPFQCTFCASNVVHGRGYRTRSVEKIVDEIEMLIEKYGFRTFSFWDDTFTCNSKRVLEFCKLIQERNIKIKWTCGARVNVGNEDMFKEMKKSGCVMLFVGFESGNDRILELCNKMATKKQGFEFSKMARRVGISITGYFIIGLPHETRDTIMETIEFSRELKIDYAQFAVLMPLPGTAIWSMAERSEGLQFICKDWKKFSRYQTPVIKLDDIGPKELYYYYKLAYRRFYINPWYIFNRIKKLRSVSDLFQLIKNAKLFFDFL